MNMVEQQNEQEYERFSFAEQNIESSDEQRQKQIMKILPNMLFYDGRLRIYNQIILPKLEGDVLVNFCANDIFSGDEIFLNVHESAGEDLNNFCVQYQHLAVGNCRLSDSFGLKNFKKIAHCVLPRPMQADDMLIDLDEQMEYDLMLCYKNALDVALESDCHSIVFTHPLFYADRYGVAKLAIAVLTYWMDHSSYADQLSNIGIACSTKEIAQYYVEIIKDIDNRGWEEFIFSYSSALYTYLLEAFGVQNIEHDREEASGGAPLSRLQVQNLLDFGEAATDVHMLDAVFEREFPSIEYMGERPFIFEDNCCSNQKHRRRTYPYEANEDPSVFILSYENRNMNHFCIEQYGFDLIYVREHPDEVYDLLFRSTEGLQLQLSRNLSATILTIEEEFGGTLRQYRMTTQNKEGETLYFRCSRCESLMHYTNEEYRPRITVKDGFICGNCHPTHHPQCYPVAKEWVILQQLDRQARYLSLQTNLSKYHRLMIDSPHSQSEIDRMDTETIDGMAEAAEMSEQLDVVGNYNTTSMNYLTGQTQQGNKHGNIVSRGVENVATDDAREKQENGPSTNAFARLRPEQDNKNHRTSSLISIVAPRYNLIRASNSNKVRIIYKRNEKPVNATIRAIQKCENELDGRVSEELDHTLAAQENRKFWRSSRFLETCFAPSLRAIGRRGRRCQNLRFMELCRRGRMVVGDDNQTLHPPVGQSVNIDEEHGIIHDSTEQPAINASIESRQLSNEQWPKPGSNPMIAAESQFDNSDCDVTTSIPERKVQTQKRNSNKFRKFRVIRKRGVETNLAFDWREADLNGIRTTRQKSLQAPSTSL